jgi:hypothetical protein
MPRLSPPFATDLAAHRGTPRAEEPHRTRQEPLPVPRCRNAVWVQGSELGGQNAEPMVRIHLPPAENRLRTRFLQRRVHGLLRNRPTSGNCAPSCASTGTPTPSARATRRQCARSFDTSSARSKIASGIVTPIALAVFRLTTSRNLVGSWTGRSAGLAPFRILST